MELQAKSSCSVFPDKKLIPIFDLADSFGSIIPVEAIHQLEYFQPEIGCFNRCSFCSQDAGNTIWKFSRNSLRDLAKQFGEGAKRLGEVSGDIPAVAGGKSFHKPGVIFPYLDNDIFSCTLLSDYIAILEAEMNCKVRLTTVGFSRKNQELSEMHSVIASTQINRIDGLRISLTPYAIGWVEDDFHSRDEYIKDLTNLLCCYKSLLCDLGPGQDDFCVELRFAPQISTEFGAPVVSFENGKFTIACGPHVVQAVDKDTKPPSCQITSISGKRAELSGQGLFAFHFEWDGFIGLSNTKINAKIEEAGSKNKLTKNNCEVFYFEHQNYYAIDPFLRGDNSFSAIHFYIGSEVRYGGFNDARRHVLDAINTVRTRGTHTDIGAHLLRELERKCGENSPLCAVAKEHIEEHQRPLFAAYLKAHSESGLPEELLLDKNWLIDTGQIVNQGRARKIFKDLGVTANTPYTPNEERGYGVVSKNSLRGNVWRLSPMPNETMHSNKKGRRNQSVFEGGSALLEELDPWLFPTGRAYQITGVEIEMVHLNQAADRYLTPGRI